MVPRWLPGDTGCCSSLHIQWRKRISLLSGTRCKSFPLICLAKIIGVSTPGAIRVARGKPLMTWANHLVWNGCWESATMSIANIAWASHHHHPPHTGMQTDTFFTCPRLFSLSFSGIYYLRGERPLQKCRQKLWSFKCLGFPMSKISSLETFMSESMAHDLICTGYKERLS